VKEKTKIINQINDISTRRISLYKTLNKNYNTLILDTSNNNSLHENEMKQTTKLENELNNQKSKINSLIEDKNSKIRAVEINTYDSDLKNNNLQLTKIVLFFTLLFIILGVLSKFELLPSNIVNILTTILLVLLIIIISFRLLDIYGRNNMNFDEYNMKNMSTKLTPPTPTPTQTSSSSKKSILNGLNLGTCIGTGCCSSGTKFNKLKRVCEQI
jgi:hypothetical protein